MGLKRSRIKSMLAAIALTLLLAAFIMVIIDNKSKPHGTATFACISQAAPHVILDAGHGGQDGGAVSKNGTCEAGINLEISLRAQAIMRFLGVNAMLTRSDGQSLDFAPDATTRANKNADLKARLTLAHSNPSCDFLSIHLNKFGQSQYFGAQVFYSANNADSTLLATSLQLRMRDTLDPQNTRQSKPAPDSVFLMSGITSPAVTIECGFLSNEAEETKLRTPVYQTKIALAITMGYIDYLKGK